MTDSQPLNLGALKHFLILNLTQRIFRRIFFYCCRIKDYRSLSNSRKKPTKIFLFQIGKFCSKCYKSFVFTDVLLKDNCWYRKAKARKKTCGIIRRCSGSFKLREKLVEQLGRSPVEREVLSSMLDQIN